MSPVRKIILPDNGRSDFDPEGSEDLLGAFVTLPIPMPRTIRAWADPVTGRPVALWADNNRIRPEDFGTVLTGIEQYNADLAAQGEG